MFIQPDGSHDGQEVLLQQIIEHLGVDFGDITHKADVLTVRVFFLHGEQAAVLAADPHGVDPQFLHHGHQALVYLAQHHLRQFHGLVVGDPQTVYKFGLLTHFFHPAADLLAAAVDDDGLEAHQLQESHVLDHIFLQFLIAHGTAAVFDHNDFAVEFLNVGQCLDQGLRLVHHQFHILFHISSSLLTDSSAA